MGSRVSRSTSLTSATMWYQHKLILMHSVLIMLSLPLSVISANVKLALLCKSRLSEYTSVLNACKGGPEKKSTSARCETHKLAKLEEIFMLRTFSR